mmetsp:Transcript_75986/g.246079  ORF Transcript_75986/g.246079 Transcript_75986/m.246079 type:complete len:211 (-) Transcript_75986:281-913(-)
MKPPAFLIRLRSTFSAGLWSRDKPNARAPRASRQRESPALATRTCGVSPRWTKATTAVEPMPSGPSPLAHAAFAPASSSPDSSSSSSSASKSPSSSSSAPSASAQACAAASRHSFAVNGLCRRTSGCAALWASRASAAFTKASAAPFGPSLLSSSSRSLKPWQRLPISTGTMISSSPRPSPSRSRCTSSRLGAPPSANCRLSASSAARPR